MRKSFSKSALVNLLGWFDGQRRDLPWRKTRDPYAIWVSEVMLQQTQVATVIPYYERFLLAFPSVVDLARATEQQVLRLWEGLGYYRRARDLHRAARIIRDVHGGVFPCDPAVVVKIPGFGRYTTGAVLSQAFDLPLPIVEANSQRVLCRLLGLRGDPRSGPVRRQLWQTAEAILPEKRVGDFNQALMELGALVCTPAAPRCPSCPLARGCTTRRHGLQGEIPARPAPPLVVPVNEVVVLVRRDQRILLVQRPASGRWANLWEFPHTTLEDKEAHEAAAARLLADQLGLKADLGAEFLTIRHGVTRFRITMVCLEARYRGGSFRPGVYPQGTWVNIGDLPGYPVSAPQRRLAERLAEHGPPAPRRGKSLV